MDLEAEIERADLIAEALRSHQRLGAIEAEYHAKLKDFGIRANAEFAGRVSAVEAEFQERIAELQREIAYHEKTAALNEARHQSLARRLRLAQARARAAPRKKARAKKKP